MAAREQFLLAALYHLLLKDPDAVRYGDATYHDLLREARTSFSKYASFGDNSPEGIKLFAQTVTRAYEGKEDPGLRELIDGPKTPVETEVKKSKEDTDEEEAKEEKPPDQASQPATPTAQTNTTTSVTNAADSVPSIDAQTEVTQTQPVGKALPLPAQTAEPSVQTVPVIPEINPVLASVSQTPIFEPIIELSEYPDLAKDPDYNNIISLLKRDWLRKHPGVDFSSAEGQLYLKGNPGRSGKQFVSLQEQAAKKFAQLFPSKLRSYRVKDTKIFENFLSDPIINRYRREILRLTNERAESSQTREIGGWNKVHSEIAKRLWDQFVYLYPEKAVKYAQINSDIKTALERLSKRGPESSQLQQKPATKPRAGLREATATPTALSPSDDPEIWLSHLRSSGLNETQISQLVKQAAHEFGVRPTQTTGRRVLISRGAEEPSLSTRFRMPRLSMPSAARDLGSKAEIVGSRALNRGLTGAGNMLGGLARGLGGGSGSGGGFSGGSGGGGSGLPGQLGNAALRGLRPLASGAARAGLTAGRGVVAMLGPWGLVVLLVVLLTIGVFMFGNLLKTSAPLPAEFGIPTVNACYNTVGSCPNPEAIRANRQNRNSCHGLKPAINIFDTAVTSLPDSAIQSYITKYQPQSSLSLDEFTRRVNIIVSKSRGAGLNPVIFLGLWKSETKFGATLGCAPTLGVKPFEEEVACGLGINKEGGALSSRCAVSRNPNSDACKQLAATRINNSDKYHNDPRYLLPNGINSFDEFMEAYGSFSPDLEGPGKDNNNCVHSYNEVLEVALELGACNSSVVNLANTGQITTCKFYRNDQLPGSKDCPPVDQGFRCDKGLEYKSPVLLSYINEVSQKAGIPPSVLAGLVRVESTVPSQYSATGKSYSISDYTDDDIKAMENFSSQVDYKNLDTTIGSSNKALCPRSITGALGITQIQPPVDFVNKMEGAGLLSKADADVGRSAHKDGLTATGKADDQQTLKDYCDPKSSLTMAANFILFLKGGKWSPPSDEKSYIDSLAKAYYGQDSQTSAYGASLYDSYSQCKTKPSSSTDTLAQQPNNLPGLSLAQPNSANCPSPSGRIGGSASCPIPNGTIGCASFGPVREWSGFGGVCRADSSGNGGHCNSIYQSSVGICTKRDEGGNLIRTAKSIDVAAPGTKAGDPIYLPSIKGISLSWKFKGAVSAGSDFGFIRLFQSEETPEGIYSLHLVHVNQASPALQINQEIRSGEVGATILNPWIPYDPWPHVHITIGLNVGDSADNLKDYSPGWLSADRDLYMCTGKEPESVNLAQSQNLSFPVKNWKGGVRLHWGEQKGGSDFPSEKPSNPDQWLGTEVLAVENGIVEEVNKPDYKGPGGNYVQIINENKNLRYYYAHLNEKRVKEGDQVRAGQIIGTLGKSCFAGDLCDIRFAHLHLGIGPEISFGSGPNGGIGNYDATGLLCKILGKQVNDKGECP